MTRSIFATSRRALLGATAIATLLSSAVAVAPSQASPRSSTPAGAASPPAASVPTSVPVPGLAPVRRSPAAAAPASVPVSVPVPGLAPVRPPATTEPSAAAPPAVPEDRPAPGLAIETRGAPVATRPPAGFEALLAPVVTDFDVTFQGRRVGAFRATLADGSLTFADPQAVAAALGDRVVQDRVAEFLSRPQSANEALRCTPGQTVDCGVLPPGQPGVIVDPDTFQVSIFLDTAFYLAGTRLVEALPDPVSGPSMIQNARLAFRGDLVDGETDVVAGLQLETYASVGRTSLVVESALSEGGFQIDRLFAQTYTDTQRRAAGLLRSEGFVTLQSLSFIGVEVGVARETRGRDESGFGPPIQFVLSQPARVEVYRGSVLLSTQEYQAGLQFLDLRSVPEGSYPVRLVARAGGTVILDEQRVVTKLSSLPPMGTTEWSAAAGVRTLDAFSDLGLSLGGAADVDVLPEITSESFAEISAARRIGRAAGVRGALTLVDDVIYPTLGVDWFNRFGTVSASATTGGDVGHSLAVTATTSIGPVLGLASFRSTRTNVDRTTAGDRYVAFFQDEDAYALSAQTSIAGGSLSARWSLTERLGEATRRAYALQYSRQIDFRGRTSARLTLDASRSDDEDRIGFTISFFRRLSERSFVSVTAGADQIDRPARAGGGPDGLAQNLQVDWSRFGAWRGADYTTSIGLVSDRDRTGAQASASAQTNRGSAEIVASVERRAESDEVSTAISGQVTTGFAIGGGRTVLGLRRPGEAAIIFDLQPLGRMEQRDVVAERMEMEAAASPTPVAPVAAGGEGGRVGTVSDVLRQDRRRLLSRGVYRPQIGGVTVGAVAVGDATAVVLPSFEAHQVTLQPENAPPFDLDLSPRTVPLYPGNVVRLEWSAVEVRTYFGQLVAPNGLPIAGARVEFVGDVTITDADGYFTITGPLDGSIVAQRRDGSRCRPMAMNEATGTRTGTDTELMRLGRITCTSEGP